MKSPEALAGMSTTELVNWLMGQIDGLHAQAIDGDVAAAHDLLNVLHGAQALASGVVLEILELAEAMLRPLARSELSGREIAIRGFLRRFPAQGADLLREIVASDGLPQARVAGLTDEVQSGLRALVDAGVLEARSGRFGALPAARRRLLDVIEPAPFRIWADVENARKLVAALPQPELQARALAGHFGVTTEQARRFLSRNGLLGASLFGVRQRLTSEPAAPTDRMGSTIPERTFASTASPGASQEAATTSIVGESSLQDLSRAVGVLANA